MEPAAQPAAVAEPSHAAPADSTAASTPASGAASAAASPLRRVCFYLAPACGVIALALDHTPVPNASTDVTRLMVRLGSAFALAGAVAAALWLYACPAPRRLRWLGLISSGAVFVHSMFEYGARGR